MCVYIGVCMLMYMHVCIYVCMYVCVYIHIYVYACLNMDGYMFVPIRTCIYPYRLNVLYRDLVWH